MGGLQAPQAAQSSIPARKQVPTFVNLEDMQGGIKIDPYDDIEDISHKKAVNKYIYAQCPAAKAVNLHSRKIDAVNLSLSYNATIDSLADVTGLPLTRDNLAKYRPQIAAWLRPPQKKNGRYNAQELDKYMDKMEKNGLPIEAAGQFEQLEDITKKGIPVFVSGGNATSIGVNLLGFANGVKTVGALDRNGHKAPYSANNSLITIWEQGDYPVKQVIDAHGNILGYNITGGIKLEIPLNQTTGRPPFKPLLITKNKASISSSEKPTPKIVGDAKGTSFAAPTIVGKYLRQKYGKDCDLN